MSEEKRLNDEELNAKLRWIIVPHLRAELTACRLKLQARNAEVKALRSQLRLLNRVMRLKNEAICEAPSTQRSRETPMGAARVGKGFSDL